MFTRHLYAYCSSKNLKLHHHVCINAELRLDLVIWQQFLKHPSVFARPFIDFSKLLYANEIQMYTDATTNEKLGFGATCGKSWLFSAWDEKFIKMKKPSIEYLEFFALVAGGLTWLHRFKNK